MKKVFLFVFLLLPSFSLISQEEVENYEKLYKTLKDQNERLNHRIDVLEKSIDDLMWFQRVGDVAFVDKQYITGPPLAKEKNPTAQGAGNPVKFYTYVFIPKTSIRIKSILF
jgi:hypothetical protein